jgi:hypothetical protein
MMNQSPGMSTSLAQQRVYEGNVAMAVITITPGVRHAIKIAGVRRENHPMGNVRPSHDDDHHQV